MYNDGAPINALAPLSADIGINEQNAIENGIIAMLDKLEFKFVRTIPMIVKVKGPTNEISASSLSVALSNFFPNREEGLVLNSGLNIAEKNIFPKLSTDSNNEMMAPIGNPPDL